MKRFAQLYGELDATNSTNAKLAALERYFREAPAADAAWAVYFLTGNKPRQVVPSRRMYELAAEMSATPLWLMDECYEAVGDLAETVAHVLPPATMPNDAPLGEWVESRLLPLATASDEERTRSLRRAWSELDGTARLVWNKLITGEFRIGASTRSVTRALATISGIDQAVIAHRLAGTWRPSARNYTALVSPDGEQGETSRPYPLFLAYSFESDPFTLGNIADWQAEWKWDGIRGQLIRRGHEVYLWSRGDDLINDSFPELVQAGSALPEGVAIDGEIVVWENDRAAPFNALQQHIGRKAPGKALIAKAPATLIAYHLLELHGADMRGRPLAERRAALEALIANAPPRIRISPTIDVSDWDELAAKRAGARELGVEGVMLKRRDSAYGVGRVRGPWWKWKVEPYTIDAVLMYAQRGHGRRASSIPITPSASGITTRWCRSRKLIPGSPMRRFAKWIPSYGSTRSRSSDLCASYRRISYASLHSKASSTRRATSPASPCASHASRDCDPTRSRRTPTPWIPFVHFSERTSRQKSPCRKM